MKRLTLLLLTFVLIACSPATNAEITPIAKPVATDTLVPENTEIPASPTATSIPLPQELAGYTKDTSGNYVKADAETGIVYTWTLIKNAEEDVLFEGGISPKTIGKGIPLVDYGDVPGRVDFGFIQIFVTDNALGGNLMPQLFHADQVPSQDSEVNLAGIVLSSLEKRILNVKTQPHGMDAYNADQSIMDETASIDFYIDTPENMLSWHISPKNGAIVIISNWDDMEGAHEGSDASNGAQRIHFRSRILGIDSNGELITQLAIQEPLNSLTPFQYDEIMILQVAGIVDLEGKDQTTPDKSDTFFDWLSFIDNISPSTGKTWVELIYK